MKVVMVDMDGVVIDEQYRVTKNISGTIDKVSTSACLIVPNSDTPIRRLRENFKNSLKFTPEVLIGEKGAVVAIRNETFVTRATSANIENYRFRLTEKFAKERWEIVVGDSVEIVKSDKQYKPKALFLIVDAFREQSVGFFFRKTSALGILEKEMSCTETGIETASHVSLPKGFELDANPVYGIAIASDKSVNKTDGYLFLRNRYPKADFYMVGDSNSDIIESNDVTHCAVGNASDKLKSLASFTSRHRYTEGLEDCIKWIMKQ